MDILLLRHAKAEERALLRRDARRELTRGGRQDMARAAKGLRRLVAAIDVLATSPLVRARQTAEVLARRYDGLAITVVAALAPGGQSEALLAWLREQEPQAVVALVGHEPDLGVLASFLLAGRGLSFLPLKKAGACLIRFADGVEVGAGQLVWLLPPRTLRALA